MLTASTRPGARDSRRCAGTPSSAATAARAAADGSTTPTSSEPGQATVLLRVESAEIPDADDGGAHQGGVSRRHLLRGAIVLAHLQRGAADDPERGPARTATARATRSSIPAVSDQPLMPRASTAPTPISTQGLASYRVFGIQERIGLVYSRARPRRHFVTMTRYAFFANIRASGPLQRLVPGVPADRAGAGRRLRAHARAHFLRRLLAARPLRGSERRPHCSSSIYAGLAGRLRRLLDRAVRAPMACICCSGHWDSGGGPAPGSA